MVREFNDYEFKLYGSVQSFFYRCWKGFGRGQVLDGGRRKLINQDLTNKWALDLFPTGSSPKSGFLVESLRYVWEKAEKEVAGFDCIGHAIEALA